jgi:hypothetical protein
VVDGSDEIELDERRFNFVPAPFADMASVEIDVIDSAASALAFKHQRGAQFIETVLVDQFVDIRPVWNED